MNSCHINETLPEPCCLSNFQNIHSEIELPNKKGDMFLNHSQISHLPRTNSPIKYYLM